MNFVGLYRKYPLFFKFTLIFVLMVGKSLIFEKNIFICADPLGVFLIIFHRMIGVFTFLVPFLFGFYRIHLLFIIISMCLWIYNGNCILTNWHNKLCGIDEKYDNNFFQYLFTFLGMDMYHGLLFLWTLLILYDVYMIYNGH